MTIHHQQFLHAIAIQALYNIFQYGLLGGGIHIHGHVDIGLTCIHSHGYGGQNNHLAPLFPAHPGRLIHQGLCFIIICSIRQMKIVGLGGSPGEDGQFKFLFTDI